MSTHCRTAITGAAFCLFATALALNQAPLTAGVKASATPQVQDRPAAPVDARDPRLNQGPKVEATGQRVMVSTQLPIATDAALTVLREGGNAVDAMITAVFLQHVNDYHQVMHFGSMSAIYFEAATGKYYALSAVAERPRADRCGSGDASKVATGGVVRGLEALAKRFGTRQWASYLQPAIASAEEGTIVTSFMYATNYELWQSGELIQKNKEAETFYMPDGFLIPVGHRWKMPALAATMRHVAAEGADYLYTGAWGQKFVNEANKRGGCVVAADLAEYRARWDEPVRFTYRGHDIVGSPPPDTGGLFVGHALNILENFDLKSSGHYASSAATLELLTRAFGRVESETRGTIQDPLNFGVPAAVWLSKEYGRSGAEFVRGSLARPELAASPATTLSQPEVHTASEADELGSNHNVIVDAQGNWISLLHTGHGGLPGVLIDGVRATGSAGRGYTKGPGRRVVLPITAIMIAKDGKPWLAMGTPGNPPQPVTEVLVNMLDFGMSPAEAVDAPRFWSRGNDRVLEIESRVTKEAREGVAARGITVNSLSPYNWHTGSMQIVWRDPAGRLHGITDPRRLGVAAGF